MIWLVLRRQRAALLVAAGLVAATAVSLLVLRLRAPAWASEQAMAGCPWRLWPSCPGGDEIMAWMSDGHTTSTVLAVRVLPVVVGIATGVGLFGREFEHGTHVFAWTQSIGRLRWFATGLLVVGVPVAVVMGLLGVLTGWATEPLRVASGGGSAEVDLLTYATTGLLPSAYALLGFVLAAVSGLLLRSALAAVGLAAALCVVAQFWMATQQDFVGPMRTATSQLTGTPTYPDGAWIVETGYLDAQGRAVHPALTGCPITSEQEAVACAQDAGAAARFVTYQPMGRYWSFQLAEAGTVLGLAGLALLGGLAGLTVGIRGAGTGTRTPGSPRSR
jgi:hypothetical protein